MKTILIVEDDANQAMLYAEELADEGYRVLWAESGNGALAMIGEARPDMVLLDVGLRDVEGAELLRQIRSLEPQLPIIVNTAYPSCDDELLRLACACVVKSSDLSALKNHIRAAVQPDESEKDGRVNS